MSKMINQTKIYLSLVFALTLLVQIRGVSAAPVIQNAIPFTGIIQSITLETDTVTGVTIVSVDVMNSDQGVQTVRLSQETAIALGLVLVDGDGQPTINDLALGKPVEIEAEHTIPAEQEDQHPIASALATFFGDISGIDYDTIMAAHEQGVGFGVIAQSLWLTARLEGDAEIFETLIEAKQTGDYSAFTLEDGSSPQNWGQLRKAILGKGKDNSVGVVISHSHPDEHGNGNDHSNNGNPTENGNGNSNESSNENRGGGKDRDNRKDNDHKK